MKFLHLSLMCLISAIGFAQTAPVVGCGAYTAGSPMSEHYMVDNIGNLTAAEQSALIATGPNSPVVYGLTKQLNDHNIGLKATDGSFLLFEGWTNNARVVVGDKSYSILNTNFHVENDELISKLEDGTLFIFDLNSLDSFEIEGRVFKRLLDPRDGINKVYEVVYDSENISLLKKHSTSIREASPNPMLNRTRNKIIKKEDYVVYRDNMIEDFDLKKSDYLSLVDKANKKILEAEIKKNKLSFKEESDAKIIFEQLERLNLLPTKKSRLKAF